MKRKREIKKHEKHIESLSVQIKSHELKIEQLKSREDIKFSTLYKALEGVKTIKGGYDSGKIKIDLEEGEAGLLKCTVSSKSEIDSAKKYLVRDFIKDLFDVEKVEVKIIEL